MASQASFLAENATLDSFSEKAFGQMIAATRAANSLPGADSHSFYSTFPVFKEGMDDLGKRILVLAEGLLRSVSTNEAPEISSIDTRVDDSIARFEDDVLPFLDDLYERIDLFIDDRTGEREKTKQVASSPSILQVKSRPDFHVLHGSNILRPQDSWKTMVDNSPTPFVPKIVEKPHSLVPLHPVFSKIKVESNGLGRLRRKADLQDSSASFPHPYEHELSHLDWTEEALQPRKEEMFAVLETTPLHIVSTVPALQEMMSVLERSEEIAIDLEHHDYRSYLGFTCLIQISTRREDFIVDPLPLMDELHVLNRVTANPKKLKVMHGADRDILWLQRDFGVYVVNMFDTGQASRVLDMPSFALAFLLKHYCSVSADKQYQLADWRIRPLPEEMVKYAREDTHYLLYIYDRLRNEALARGNESANLLRSIFDRSRELCLLTFEKEMPREDAFRDLYEKSSYSLDPRQLRVFATLFKWRDGIGRLEDESVRYVLPNHMMFLISETAPNTTSDLIALLKPIPPLVRVHASEIVTLIKQAAEEPTDTVSSHATGKPSLFQEPSQFVSGIGVKTVVKDPASETVAQHVPISVIQSKPKPKSSSEIRPPPSPVLTTDQLYVRANWMDDPLALKPSKGILLAAQNQSLSSSAPGSMMFASTETSEGDQHDDESDSEESTKLAELISRSFTSELLLPTRLDFDYLRVAPEQNASEPQDDEGDEDNEVLESRGTTTEGAPDEADKDHKPTKAPSLKEMPQSLAEIYKLSNKNRKRKKKSKKQLDDAQMSPLSLKSGTNQEDSSDEEREKKRPRQGDLESQKSPHAGLSNVDFMREIGWLKKDAPVPVVVSGSRADANAVNAMNLKMQTRDEDDDDFSSEPVKPAQAQPPVKPKPQKPAPSANATSGKSSPNTSPQKAKAFTQSQPAAKPHAREPQPSSAPSRGSRGGGGGQRGASQSHRGGRGAGGGSGSHSNSRGSRGGRGGY